MRPDFSSELNAREGFVVGVDEVGRGCIAGPVVAAAVLFPRETLSWAAQNQFFFSEKRARIPSSAVRSSSDLLPQRGRCNEPLFSRPWWDALDDSKKLSPELRALLAKYVRMHCGFAISFASADEIDRVNILKASMLAMRRAIGDLVASLREQGQEPRHLRLLVDGHMDPLSEKFGTECLSWMEDLEGVAVETLIQGDGRSFSIAAASVIAKVHRDSWMEELDHQFPGYGFGRHKGYLVPQHVEALEERGPCALHRHSFEPVARLRGLNR